jgi:hypothetical protein
MEVPALLEQIADDLEVTCQFTLDRRIGKNSFLLRQHHMQLHRRGGL